MILVREHTICQYLILLLLRGWARISHLFHGVEMNVVLGA